MDTSPTPSPDARPLSAPVVAVPAGNRRGPGFGTLLAVDLWERFSFFGMAAILVLYLTASEARGGLGMAPQPATALFAAYMSLTFMAGLPGGWLADRLLGARRAVLLGGVLITCGHAVLAVPVTATLYAGLLLVVAGTGLVKPAMAAMVAGVSGAGQGRREAAFSLFYMCIQASALVAPVVTGLLAERVAWHLGFGAAALGMTAGLIQFAAGLHRYGDVVARPPRPLPRPEAAATLRRVAWATVAVGALLVLPAASGLLPLPAVLAVLGLTTVTLPFWYLCSLRRTHALGAVHKRRLTGFTALMAASAAFWMIFAQSGSVLSLFAERHTDRDLLGFEVPASWFQSVHPLLVLLAAPLFARLWLRAGPRVDVSVKFAGALVAAGLSFLLMAVAARLAEHGPVGPQWLLLVYLLYSCGEIALAPAGLALAATVAPPGSTSRLLAVNGMFGAVGVVVGGQLFRLTAVLSPAAYFLLVGSFVLLAGTAVALGTPRLRRLLGRQAGSTGG